MITRIARHDVVRLTRTGEVGTVVGWADHQRLAQHGTIIDVELSRDKVVQANGRALEFVADAKVNMTKGTAVVVLLSLIVAIGNGAAVVYNLSAGYRTPWWYAVAPGIGITLMTWRTLWMWFIRPRKTRITLPADYVTVPGTRGVGRPPMADDIRKI